MKRNAEKFLASFAITMIIIGTICGFVIVDKSTAQYGFGDMKPLFSLSKMDEMTYESSFFGGEYYLSLEPLNTIEKYRKEYAVITTPRSIRLFLMAKELTKQVLTEQFIAYKEKQYEHNTANTNLPLKPE